MAQKRVRSPRIIEVLQTRKGQEVLQAAGASLAEKLDPVLAYKRAVRAAEKNGILVPLQIALGLDLLEHGTPFLLDMLQNAARTKRPTKGR